MDIGEKESRLEVFIRKLSNELCYEMSRNKNTFEMQKEFYKFVEIYNSGYRHSYNRIFLVVNDIRKENESLAEPLYINVNANYEYIQSEILPKLKEKDEDKYRNVINFFDHLLLEISRMDTWLQFEQRIEAYEKRLEESDKRVKEYEKRLEESDKCIKEYDERVKEYDKRISESTALFDKREKMMAEMIDKTKEDVLKAQKEINSTKDETDKIKTDFITILSIFVAIIMGFAGVVGFGGNIMANLNNIIIYKAIFMMLVSGLVLFNGIFLMLHIVAKLTGRSIAHLCNDYLPKVDKSSEAKTNNKHDCGSCQSSKCGIWKRVKVKFPYTAHFNEILISGLLINLIAWIINHGALGWAINNDCTYIINEYRGYMYRCIIGLFILLLFYIFLKNKRIFNWSSH